MPATSDIVKGLRESSSAETGVGLAFKCKLAASEIERLRSDFDALQKALVGNTGLSAIQEAHRLRALHPLTTFPKKGT